VVDLGDQSLWIKVGGKHRTDFRARRIVTMHARPWKKPGFDMRVLSFDIGDQLDPMNGTTLRRLPRTYYWDIILGLAGNHASLTGGAFI
jgi:hypothetical protein